MADQLGRVVISEEEIARRVAELGAALSRDYAGRTPLLIGVSISTAPFLADLARAMPIDVQLELIALRPAADRSGMRFENDVTVPIEGRSVVLVVDIVETGATLQYLMRTLRARGPASLAVCLLIDRNRDSAATGDLGRESALEIAYTGFVLPPVRVAGYGLDLDGQYRELACLREVCAGSS